MSDDDGFFVVECRCGVVLGPAPDRETVLDMAMEHAWHAALVMGSESSELVRTYRETKQ